MRKFRTILVWIAISLILQCGVLFYLDQVYFKDNAKVNMKQVDIKNDLEKLDKHPQIPTGATSIKPSYDGKYLSYYDNGSLNVLDGNSGEIQNFDLVQSGPVLDSLWLSDRNVLLTLENVNGRIELYSYDARKKQNEKMIDITYYSQYYKTFDIQSSPITGVTYVKVGGGVFRIDINQSHAEAVPITVKSVGSMDILPTKDRLVYIAEGGSVIHMTQPSQREVITGYGPLKIIGIDENDTVYLVKANNDKVSKILKKDLNNETSKVETIDLGVSASLKDIFVKDNGNLYVNDSSKNEVKEIKSGKTFKYEGSFIGMYQSGIASKKDNKLYRVPFN